MKILVIDEGYGLEIAHRLSQDGNEVFYFVPWQKGTPEFKDWAIGLGFPITKVNTIDETLDDIDMAVFSDLGFGSLAHVMRKDEIPVFGAGLAERLELDRIFAKQIFDDYEINYPETAILEGIDNTLQYIRSHNKPVVIKVNRFRGTLESAPIRNFDEAKMVLNQIVSQLGPYEDKFRFIVEDLIDGVQIGVDTFVNGTKILRPKFFAFERDMNVIGKWQDSTVMDSVLQKLIPYLQRTNYRGQLSIEAIYDGSDLYVIDITARPAYPLSMIFVDSQPKYSDLLYQVARGSDNPPLITQYNYEGLLTIRSNDANHKWLYLNVKDTNGIRFYKTMRTDNNYYSIPEQPIIANALGSGTTIDETTESMRTNADKVTAFGSIADFGIIDTIKKDIALYEDLSGEKF